LGTIIIRGRNIEVLEFARGNYATTGFNDAIPTSGFAGRKVIGGSGYDWRRKRAGHHEQAEQSY
jgi:hypothetical protein